MGLLAPAAGSSPGARPPARLFMIMAREAPVAAIFRRGPSRWVCVIKWDTQSDRLEYGHWFKGRIYERRCDLSPDGSKLIYFVSKFNARTVKDREYTYAWTAISKLPWLTALALWPKGDCWHGGGTFLSNTEVLLNHKPEQAKPHPEHEPQGICVLPNPDAAGEDDPLYSTRLTRDGWVVVQEWRVHYTYPGFFHTDQPELRELAHPCKSQRLVMERAIRGLRYRETFQVLNLETGQRTDLEGADFASWDHRGRLAMLRQGTLLTGHVTEAGELSLGLLADFNRLIPRAVDSPDWAKVW